MNTSLCSNKELAIQLPVDAHLPEIAGALAATANLVIEAPPGAGKTTRVPPALLAAGFGEVLVLEPRRLAARLAARRVATEMGESVGETVGFHVRFEQQAGPRTKLRFLTEGVLTRRLLAERGLPGVGCVILDEFHERHLEGDLALALLLHLQRTSRPDLRLVVMSATIEGGRVAALMGGCPVIRTEGRLYPLETAYTPSSSGQLEVRVAEAVEGLLVKRGGDILVFLPGAAEIRRCHGRLERIAERFGALVLPLHGDLPAAEQDRAVNPAAKRKIILSTNVAESSITIDGVTAVVDSGLARVASDSPWTGLPRLEVRRVSRASAQQRAGRAARTAPGAVVRLYPEADFLSRPEHEEPEILRRELSQFVLDLKAAGIEQPESLAWLDPPPAAAVAAAEGLLVKLGAIDRAGRLTELGRRVAGLPLHPRLASMIVRAGGRGAGEQACAAAAALSAGERLPELAPHGSRSDLLVLLEGAPEGRIKRLEHQIRRLARPRKDTAHGDQALLRAILEAFPDRVARRRRGRELRMAGGISVEQAGNSTVQGELLVVLEVEDRPEQGLPLARLVSEIEPEWLFDIEGAELSERVTVEWNRQAERVDALSAVLYADLVIEESRTPAPAEEAARLLMQKALEAGVGRFAGAEKLAALQNRWNFAAAFADLPAFDDSLVAAALERLSAGLRSFAELERATRDGGLEQALLALLDRRQRQALDEIAPERIQLPGGRRAPVVYRPGQAPAVASRLQDFFGMKSTPRVAHGQVAVTVELLAPSRRPVQVTQDLEGFWTRHYPQIRRELMRRYPRHAWPENPYNVFNE
jgi:ATP-dependent helicase HrpB